MTRRPLSALVRSPLPVATQTRSLRMTTFPVAPRMRSPHVSPVSSADRTLLLMTWPFGRLSKATTGCPVV